MQDSGGDRLLSLEGLRGLAAIVVVIFHGLSMFYPIMIYGIASGVGLFQHARIEDNLYGNPVSVVFSGAFAVAIFFVLSGFVLTVSFFSSGAPGKIMKIAGKRYPRLMIPALASVMLTLLVMASGLGWLKEQVATITGSVWLDILWPETVSFIGALNHGVWEVFFSDIDAVLSYNPVLWTMRYELLGSLLVFALALIFGKAKHRWVIYVLAIIATFQTWYLAFIIGMVLADLYAMRKFPFHVSNKQYGWLVLLLVVGIFLGGYAHTTGDSGVYTAFRIPLLSDDQNHSFYLSVGASLLLIAVIGIKPLSRILGSKHISMLGKYSFSVYLTHMVVLFTVGAGIFLWLHDVVGFHWAAALSILGSLVVIIPVAYIFERYVDAPSIRVSSLFSSWLFQNKDIK